MLTVSYGSRARRTWKFQTIHTFNYSGLINLSLHQCTMFSTMLCTDLNIYLCKHARMHTHTYTSMSTCTRARTQHLGPISLIWKGGKPGHTSDEVCNSLYKLQSQSNVGHYYCLTHYRFKYKSVCVAFPKRSTMKNGTRPAGSSKNSTSLLTWCSTPAC